MSSVYILAPATIGKVILHTTCGDMEIELWSKETPKASRNFVQLCMEGYYDGCIFNRVVKDFIVQTGDPTGLGGNGESIYGKPFPNEIHTRLRFNHRGIVAMANNDKKNTSEFFITLAPNADHLNGKNTIFGKIVGDSFFNALKMNDMDLDEYQRPIYPPSIINTEVIWNPFEDIVPRESVLKKRKELKEKQEPAKKKVKAAKKDFGLLSFGGEDEDEEEDLSLTIKSKLRKAPPAPKSKAKAVPKKKTAVALISEKLKTKSSDSIKKYQYAPEVVKGEEKEMPVKEEEAVATEVKIDSSLEPEKKELSKRDGIRALERERMKYKKKQSSKRERQKKTLASLAAFNASLVQLERENPSEDLPEKETEQDDSWMNNRLQFRSKDIDYSSTPKNKE